MRRTSSATLEFPDDTLVIVVFPFIVYEEAYTCLSIVGLRVVQQVTTLESGKLSSFLRTFPSPNTSH